MFTHRSTSALLLALAITNTCFAGGPPVYVSTTGNDVSGTGTAANPVRTIARAYQLAAPGTNPIYIASGAYPETINLVSNIDLVGGFNQAAGWTRDPVQFATIISGGTKAVLGDADTDIILDGLVIVERERDPSRQFVLRRLPQRVRAHHDYQLWFAPGVRCRGAVGANGADGRDGGPGGPGGSGCENGGLLCFHCDWPRGGSYGTSPVSWWGANGGDSGLGSSAGSAGQDAPGLGGGAGGSAIASGLGDYNPPNNAGSIGGDGANGAVGVAGAPGRNFGALAASGYAGSTGGTGGRGLHGYGGGGGGGGGGGVVSCDSFGGGGGGGGGGAEGGAGGDGGAGGGGSFGLWSRNGAAISILSTSIHTSNGGAGGLAGQGGTGGVGGAGGHGSGNRGNAYGGSSTQDDGSNGARGGNGGNGGRGGIGGGGGGGPSVGIVNDSPVPLSIASVAFTLGTGGPGGSVPGGHSGLTGLVAETRGYTAGADCNGNGVPDSEDIASGASTDCNGNGIPDECDIPTLNPISDCNADGTPDICQGIGPLSGMLLNFDGTSSYVQVGPVTALIAPASFTLEAWIYPTGPGSDDTAGGAIICKEGEYLLQRFPDGTIRWALARSTSGWNFVNTGAVAPLLAWTHVALTYSGGTVRVYINERLVQLQSIGSPILDANPAQDDLRFGGRQAIAQFFEGRIDDVRMWNVARTQTQIAADLGHALSGSESNLIGYWPFDTVSNLSTPDLARGHDATLVGATPGPAMTCVPMPPCPADFNHDGSVNSQDFFDFLTAFFAANADFNRDGTTNSQDFFDFITAFFAGC